MRDLGEIPDEKPKWIILDGDLDANWVSTRLFGCVYTHICVLVICICDMCVYPYALTYIISISMY